MVVMRIMMRVVMKMAATPRAPFARLVAVLESYLRPYLLVLRQSIVGRESSWKLYPVPVRNLYSDRATFLVVLPRGSPRESRVHLGAMLMIEMDSMARMDGASIRRTTSRRRSRHKFEGNLHV